MTRRFRNGFGRGGRRLAVIQRGRLFALHVMLRARTAQPRPPRQIARVRLIVGPLFLVTLADCVQMSEAQIPPEMTPYTALSVVGDLVREN